MRGPEKQLMKRRSFSLPDLDAVPQAPSMPPLLRSLQGLVPSCHWLPTYSVRLLKRDLGAAFTVGVVLIPQAIAYGTLTEMPPEYGLYASLVPLPVYAMLTTSRHVSVGPFALVSLLISETISPVFDPDHQPEKYRHAVLLLSFMTGVLHLVMAALKLDVLISFLSDSVIEGFTSASAILIAASQMKHFFGMPVARAYFPLMVMDVASRTDEINPNALFLGVASIALLMGTKSLNKKLCPKIQLPEMLVLLMCAQQAAARPRPTSRPVALAPSHCRELRLPLLCSSLARWQSDRLSHLRRATRVASACDGPRIAAARRRRLGRRARRRPPHKDRPPARALAAPLLHRWGGGDE